MIESFKAAIIVSSDRASSGAYQDQSGPAARAWLEAQGYVVMDTALVSDDAHALRETLHQVMDRKADLIVISGGTGLGPRDVTPQVLDDVCDYPVPGIGELLRRESMRYSLNAYLSRCGGWVKGRTLLLAVPGNPKAVVEQLGILKDLLPHSLRALRGQCEHRRRPADPDTARTAGPG